MRNLLLIVILAGALGSSSTVRAQATKRGDVIIVKMIAKSTTEWRFEPSNITARQGDVIRFVQEDIMPHNVEFKSTPKGAELADKTMGPFLLAKGETYELELDSRFLEGVYDFICTPHAQLGMTGTLTVTGLRPSNTK